MLEQHIRRTRDQLLEIVKFGTRLLEAEEFSAGHRFIYTQFALVADDVYLYCSHETDIDLGDYQEKAWRKVRIIKDYINILNILLGEKDE